MQSSDGKITKKKMYNGRLYYTTPYVLRRDNTDEKDDYPKDDNDFSAEYEEHLKNLQTDFRFDNADFVAAQMLSGGHGSSKVSGEPLMLPFASMGFRFGDAPAGDVESVAVMEQKEMARLKHVAQLRDSLRPGDKIVLDMDVYKGKLLQKEQVMEIMQADIKLKLRTLLQQDDMLGQQQEDDVALDQQQQEDDMLDQQKDMA